jgi:hypothetical protein
VESYILVRIHVSITMLKIPANVGCQDMVKTLWDKCLGFCKCPIYKFTKACSFSYVDQLGNINESGKVLTVFGLTPDHLDGIQFAMELR